MGDAGPGMGRCVRVALGDVLSFSPGGPGRAVGRSCRARRMPCCVYQGRPGRCALTVPTHCHSTAHRIAARSRWRLLRWSCPHSTWARRWGGHEENIACTCARGPLT